MNAELQEISNRIESISSVEDEQELKILDDSVNQLLELNQTELAIDVLLRVFERFPDKDGYGIFWSILHALESLGGYEKKLVESIKRQPSEFGLTMLNRLINSGQTSVDENNLLNVLKDIAKNENYSDEIKTTAADFLKYEENKLQR